MPEISIIMGVYNANKNNMIDVSIQSILMQTYTDWEFIICDDSSTDGTIDVLKKYELADKRITVIQNNENHGLAYSLNRCLEICKGNYIARMDIDDYSSPDRLAVQKYELDHMKDYSFCTSNAKLFDLTGVWGTRVMKEYVEKKDFLFTSPFIHPALLAHRKIFDEIYYSEKRASRRAEDYELFMNAYVKGYKGFNIQKELYYIREDKECYSRRKYRERWFEAYIRLKGFCGLGLMPLGIAYVVKPLIVGLIPQKFLRKIRKDTILEKGEKKTKC